MAELQTSDTAQRRAGRVLAALACVAVCCTACKSEPKPQGTIEAVSPSEDDSKPASTAPGSAGKGSPTATPSGEPQMPDASIGTATMEKDGTIVLDLRAVGPGVQGDAQLRYPKGHKEYDAVLKHLGGLRPGQSKPVPPWPDDE